MTTAPLERGGEPGVDEVGVEFEGRGGAVGLDDRGAGRLERADLEVAGDDGAELAADRLGRDAARDRDGLAVVQRAGELAVALEGEVRREAVMPSQTIWPLKRTELAPWATSRTPTNVALLVREGERRRWPR